VLDLAAKTCLPGLLDLHTHLTDSPEDTADLRVYLTRSEGEALARGRDHARATLLAGFTTVRDVGTYIAWTDRALRDEIAAGRTPGPRMQVRRERAPAPVHGGARDDTDGGDPSRDLGVGPVHGLGREWARVTGMETTRPTATAGTAPGAKAPKSHDYQTHLTWEGNLGTGTATYGGYGRQHRIRVEGKADLVGSAHATFRGDPALHDPEDLLLAAVASCHMLSYLALCARARVEVVAYEDRAHGVLELTPDGGGSFREITLAPRVVLAAGGDAAAATALHDRAAALCFIARSCNFPIHHRPEVTVAAAAPPAPGGTEAP